MGDLKWTIFLLMVIVGGGLLFGIGERTWGSGVGEGGILALFMNIRMATISLPIVGQFAIPMFQWGDIIPTFVNALSWNYAVLSGGGLLFLAKIPLLVISAAFLFNFGMTLLGLVRGVSYG